LSNQTNLPVSGILNDEESSHRIFQFSMATFTITTLSPSSSRFFTPVRLNRSPNQLRPNLLYKNWHLQRFPPLKCSSSSSESETYTSDWTYKLISGIAGIGFIETSYLSYLKFTGSDVFCPVGGDTCSSILNSDYAVVFGIVYFLN